MKILLSTAKHGRKKTLINQGVFFCFKQDQQAGGDGGIRTLDAGFARMLP